MSMKTHCTNADRPAKPYPTFPLYAHGNGQWAKKIRGQTHFFGPWADPNGALERYHCEHSDLEAGRRPRRTDKNYRLTVGDMVNLCLVTKRTLVESGEMQARTYEEYKTYGERLIRVLGRRTLVDQLTPADFLRLRTDFQKTHKSLTSIKGDIRKIKVFFNFALEEGHLERTVRFGQGFKVPSATMLRREREKKEIRMFQAKQIRLLLGRARPQMKAMILLGINCGFGNNDCAMLPKRSLDFQGGWVNFTRPKTSINRHNPLWPETVAALKLALQQRKKPRDSTYNNRVFITCKLEPWTPKYVHDSPISKEFRKLLTDAHLDDCPGFYGLRHTFATVALKTKDPLCWCPADRTRLPGEGGGFLPACRCRERRPADAAALRSEEGA